MLIYIDNKSGIPIYEQIYNQIKKYIVNGAAPPDEPLPSIRNLAKDLKISVITTKRAYEDLEKDGYIYTVPAKGCFVAPLNRELIREENLKKIEAHIEEIGKLAALCGMTKKDISEIIDWQIAIASCNSFQNSNKSMVSCFSGRRREGVART